MASEDSGFTPEQIFERNKPFIKSDASSYLTSLSPDQEKQFLNWVQSNNVPFDPQEEKPDYDMRGFWKAMQSGDPVAAQALDKNTGQMHFPDFWKTPYDLTFSAESQFANPKTAPKWNDKDQLVAPNGTVLYDDRLETMRRISQATPNPQTMAAVLTVLSHLQALKNIGAGK